VDAPFATVGLVLKLSLTDRIGHGAFADIFAPPPGNRAIKLFRRIEDQSLIDAVPHIFASEVAAYGIVSQTEALKRHVPAYFGPVCATSVLDENEADIRARYWLELGYEMQRLPSDPDERKFGSFFLTKDWALMEPLEKVFEAAGIGHLGDASVLHWKEGAPILIDFATYDAAARYMKIDE
jgi:hypothetical protein